MKSLYVFSRYDRTKVLSLNLTYVYFVIQLPLIENWYRYADKEIYSASMPKFSVISSGLILAKQEGQHDESCNDNKGEHNLCCFCNYLALSNDQARHSTGGNDVVEAYSMTSRRTDGL